MDYMALYIFVEGNDDERFFREILLPALKEKYNDIKIIKNTVLKNMIANPIFPISGNNFRGIYSCFLMFIPTSDFRRLFIGAYIQASS